MGKTKVQANSPATERRVAAVSATVAGIGPEVLLRLDPSMPRGFWARDGRWFAHLGAAATVEVSGTDPGGDRFQEVWKRARTLFSLTWKDPESEVHPPSPRLFGGFAFREDHEADGPWEGFPSAHFLLPEVELLGGSGDAVLTCRGYLAPGEDPSRCRGRLRDRLDSIRSALLAGGEEGPVGEPWVPATRVETELATWDKAVGRALKEVAEGDVSKVVLARVQNVSAEGGLDPVDVAMNLWRENPGAHVYYYEPLQGHVILGAAPETVATVTGGVFSATAVAGSAARGDSDQERKALARSLLKSRKDRLEHGMCVQDMVERLGPLSEEVKAEAEPHVLTLSSIQHLETVIDSTLKAGETVLSVLGALHPTPAVCGFPRDLALEFLHEVEPFERGWYSGPVGWFDGDGNGVFVPALRFAVGNGSEWRLFAGAGIVAGSKSKLEWDETRIKFKPVLRALSLAKVGRVGLHSPGEDDS
jgi:menaquinone-specific isochorismate synthase